MRHRTALVSAASVAGIAVGGAAAIAASLGILESSSRGEIGSLSAAVAPIETQPTVIDVYLDDTPPTPTVPIPGGEGEPVVYSVEDAGTVSLRQRSDGSVEVVSVATNAGWSWVEATDGAGVTITLTDGTTVYELQAEGGAGGIEATVDQPLTSVVITEPTGPAASTVGPTAVVDGTQSAHESDEADDEADDESDDAEHGDEAESEGSEDDWDD